MPIRMTRPRTRVLVTGASGRVGRAVCVQLWAQHEVHGLDRAPSSTASHVGDLGDEALVQHALEGVQAVVHTAALHAPHVGLLPDAEFQRVNVDATRRLYQLAAQAGVARFVFTSTTALYGAASTPPGRAGWVTEATEPQPRSIYHRSKLAAEAALVEAAAGAGARAPVLRILRMSRCFPEAAPLMAAYRLHRGVDARDVARAHALALVDGPLRASADARGTPPPTGQRARAGGALRGQRRHALPARRRRGPVARRAVGVAPARSGPGGGLCAARLALAAAH